MRTFAMDDKETVGMGVTDSGAFRQAEQVVGLLTVVFGFQVFVPGGAFGDDHIGALVVYLDEECPFAGFDPGDGVIQGEFPAVPVRIHTTNVGDPFVCAGAVGFVDAVDLDFDGHGVGLWGIPCPSARQVFA